jgi:peptidoglycan/LPS O-acetylase OafA/YrhL
VTNAAVAYRADIDGLRAIAVVLVVSHHLSSHYVPGGFVGVDIFFVISGYLISAILRREIDAGEFSFARFYERRMRRIFPAMFVVLAFVLAAGYWVLLPTDYLATTRAALGTVLFSANLVFWRDLMEGYFAADAKLNPLLHMWSLGVEEQFYLLFPALLLIFSRSAIRVVWVLMGVTVLSLACAEVQLEKHSVAVFFLLPFRAWELAIGALLAYSNLPLPSRRWNRELISLAAFIAMLAPAFLFNSETSFPAIAAIPPVLGAATLIYVGNGSTLIAQMLSWPPIVYVGLISYSLYLWHWPLIVLARFCLGMAPIRPYIFPIAACSLLLASASYHFVEKPFRRGRLLRDRGRLFRVGAGSVATIAAVCLACITTKGVESRFGAQVVALDRVRTEPVPFKGCESKIANTAVQLCVIGSASAKPDVVLWGDSHLLAWLPALDIALRQSGRAAFAAPNASCPPLLGIANPADSECFAQNRRVFDLIRKNSQVRVVVLAGFWSKYFAESNIRLRAINGEVGNASIAPPALRQTMRELLSIKKRVLLLGPVPTYQKDVPLSLAQHGIFGAKSIPRVSLDDVHKKNQAFYITVASIHSPGAEFVDVAQWLCKPACEIHRNGISMYRDTNHLSNKGSMYFLPELRLMLDPLASSNPTPTEEVTGHVAGVIR